MVSPILCSVIIPVRNEQARINRTLAALRGIDQGEDLEIIVVDGDRSGSTVAEIPDRCGVRTLTTAPGRAHQMNAGARLASGEILLFLHADTSLPSDALGHILKAFLDPQVVAGAFQLQIHSRRWAIRFIAWVANQRSRLTRIPYGDQAIFIRTGYFRRLGGYAELPLMEDVDLMRRIKKRGDRIAFTGAPVETSDRRWEREGPVYCTLRNWTLVTLYLAGVAPERLVKWYDRVRRDNSSC